MKPIEIILALDAALLVAAHADLPNGLQDIVNKFVDEFDEIAGPIINEAYPTWGTQLRAQKKAVEDLARNPEVFGFQDETKALITHIEPPTSCGSVMVLLEWGGPEDHVVGDFDLDALGGKPVVGSNCGGTLRSGWVIIDGPCVKRVGETIPLL